MEVSVNNEISVANPEATRFQAYPNPLAKYEDVVADRKLFIDTLEKLHHHMKSKFMVPTVGGRELDLHQLFVEVTSRGGFQRVIRDRRWKEVITLFNFPSTATNASFVLRKYYLSLLHHYEQLYLFGEQGWISPPPAFLTPSSVASVSSNSKRQLELTSPCSVSPLAIQRPMNVTSGSSFSGGLSSNCQVVGVIDGKCEHGYFVTIMAGSTKLKGILYHPAEQVQGHNSTGAGVQRQRRRRRLSSQDPNHPKTNRSGYNFFFAEQHARLKTLHSGKDREISKMIGELWNRISEPEKAFYQEQGAKDKERYRSELEAYKQRSTMGLVISDAIPLQQRPADQNTAVGKEIDSRMDIDGDDLPNQNDSCSDTSDSNGSKSGADSGPEALEEMAATATGSTSTAADPFEGDTFELRRRDAKVGDKHDPPSSSEEMEWNKLHTSDEKP